MLVYIENCAQHCAGFGGCSGTDYCFAANCSERSRDLWIDLPGQFNRACGCLQKDVGHVARAGNQR
jgi:hypothetical protein